MSLCRRKKGISGKAASSLASSGEKNKNSTTKVIRKVLTQRKKVTTKGSNKKGATASVRTKSSSTNLYGGNTRIAPRSRRKR